MATDPNSVMYYLQANASYIAAACVGVLVLYVFASMVFDTVKSQNHFLIVLLVSMPLVVVNAGWWALFVYIFFMLVMVLAGIRALLKGKRL